MKNIAVFAQNNKQFVDFIRESHDELERDARYIYASSIESVRGVHWHGFTRYGLYWLHPQYSKMWEIVQRHISRGENESIGKPSR